MHCPREVHLQATYRILHYLKGTPGRGILYKRNGNTILEAYTDADYAGSITDRRSTSGYCTFLGGNLVTWKSKKQDVVARSSAEAEFWDMAQGICELLWLKIILEDSKIKWDGPMKLYSDNIIVIGDDWKEQRLLSQHLAKEFEMKTIGRLKYFLGIEVSHSKKGIFIFQQKYVTD